MTTHRAPHRPWLRWLGVALVLYGLSGIVLAAAGAVLVSNSFRGVNQLAETIAAQRNVLVLSLDTTAGFLANAAGGTGTIDEGLTGAAGAAREAATLARDLGSAAEQVSQAAQFSVLGQQPFLSVATSFDQVAADARALATTLDGSAVTITTAGGDVVRIRGDLERVAAQVRQFAQNLASTTALDSLEGAFDAPRIVLYGILVWMGAQALAAVVAGLVLIWRRTAAPAGLPLPR